MGTPDFAVAALDALVAAGHEIACVYCQPPRPAGRGHKLQPSAVQRRAEALGLPVRTPLSFKKDAAARADFAALNLDVAVVAAYGLILPEEVLNAPRLGCINIHASLLPRWRGAAPIQRAILAGDGKTGISIMQMDKGLDTGPVFLMGETPITPQTTASTLHDALAALGGKLIVEALERLDTLTAVPQTDEGAIYAPMLKKEEGRVDWTRSAPEIARQIRALNPWPGVWCQHGAERLKILEAEAVEGDGAPGAIVGKELVVACGAGALKLNVVQPEGRKAMDGAAFANGARLTDGERLT